MGPLLAIANGRGVPFASKNERLAQFLNTGDAVRTNNSVPIADLFPEATVLFFADLEGFTKWSSNRKPVEVFGLLENAYSAFDAIASRRKVFKVETIGDCYVAVTGLPEVQPDHAVIMAKFAAECILKLRQVLIAMTDQYGSDTAVLSLRIGLRHRRCTPRRSFAIPTVWRYREYGSAHGKPWCSRTHPLLSPNGRSLDGSWQKWLVETEGRYNQCEGQRGTGNLLD
jgi:hypothetical protein